MCLDFLKFDSSYNHERWCHLLAAEVRSKGLDTRKMPESTWLNEWNISSDIPWSEREKTSKIIYKRLGLLKRLKRFISSRERVMFYNDLVQASMDSAAWVCSDSFIGHSNTMLCLQKYPVRIIMNYPWDASSTSLLSDLNIHPLQERVAKIKEKIVLKALNSLLLSYIAEKIKRGPFQAPASPAAPMTPVLSSLVLASQQTSFGVRSSRTNFSHLGNTHP